MDEILRFWFEEVSSKQWFKGGAEFDEVCRIRFQSMYLEAAADAFDAWRETPLGCVALCLLYDQIPRNAFRGTPRAFATDARAVAVTRHAIDKGFDLDAALDDSHRQFLYMPLMHSERIEDQRDALHLGKRITRWDFTSFARKHLAIIERFGRFPHRNVVLGRPSTPEEEAFLQQPGSSF